MIVVSVRSCCDQLASHVPTRNNSAKKDSKLRRIKTFQASLGSESVMFTNRKCAQISASCTRIRGAFWLQRFLKWPEFYSRLEFTHPAEAFRRRFDDIRWLEVSGKEKNGRKRFDSLVSCTVEDDASATGWGIGSD